MALVGTRFTNTNGFIFTIVFRGKEWYYPHFTDGKLRHKRHEGQGYSLICAAQFGKLKLYMFKAQLLFASVAAVKTQHSCKTDPGVSN